MPIELGHKGFLIPNASDVSHPRMVEPDRVDFNTMANARWGVIEGCEVTVSGSLASVTAGIAIVNGALVTVGSTSVQLNVGGSQDRFDLLGVDEGGTLKLVEGDPAADPVFPDPDLGITSLAAVFAPTGVSNLTNNVIDKRKLLSKNLLTKIGPSDQLIRNVNGTGDYFRVNGDGKLIWNNDANLKRTAAYTLQVENHLNVAQTVTTGGDITSGGTVQGVQLKGNNLQQGTTTTTPDAAVQPGSVFQHTANGKVYILSAARVWEEIATINSVMPPGTIIDSVEPPEVMQEKGWVLLDGRTVTEAQFPTLFGLVSMTQYIVNPGAPVGTRTMNLPNIEGRTRISRTTNIGKLSGAGAPGRANNILQLAVGQMPRHRHSPSLSPASGGPITGNLGRAGYHSHSMTASGAHFHSITDKPHRHYGMDFFGYNLPIIAVTWGGRNKIDALFNDRNHTYSVEAIDFIAPAYTGITGTDSAGSEHGHIIDANGDHTHDISFNAQGPHVHVLTESEAGLDQPILIEPAHLNVYTYIRS